MGSTPEMIVVSQYKVGGVQNFFFNLLSHFPVNEFSIRWIYEDSPDLGTSLPRPFNIGEPVLFPLAKANEESTVAMAARMATLISDRPGAVFANFWHDLATLHLYPRSHKTIFYVCHDEGYLKLAGEYEFMIDVFIAHNYQFYEAMYNAMPHRCGDIYFIPYGVPVPENMDRSVPGDTLKLVIAARMQESKGIMDIPFIDDALQRRRIKVEWTIIGSGPEKERLQRAVQGRNRFSFFAPEHNDEVVALMSRQDVFVLPSRLDGLPVALLESMSVGCVPVISAFNEGIRGVVTPDIGYVLPIGAHEAFADAIASLHLNRSEWVAKSAACRKKIAAEYNAPVQAMKYYALVADYLKLKKPMRNKFIRYGSWLQVSYWPRLLRQILGSVRTFFLIRSSRAYSL